MDDLNRVINEGTSDLEIICRDGKFLYPKLVGGLIFPILAKISILESPIRHTILVPEFSAIEIQRYVWCFNFRVCLTSVHSSLLGSSLVDTSMHHFLAIDLDEHECNEGFEEFQNIDYSEPPSFNCNVCYGTFKTRTSLQNHLITHRYLVYFFFTYVHIKGVPHSEISEPVIIVATFVSRNFTGTRTADAT